jgi:hypothetical protein
MATPLSVRQFCVPVGRGRRVRRARCGRCLGWRGGRGSPARRDNSKPESGQRIVLPASKASSKRRSFTSVTATNGLPFRVFAQKRQFCRVLREERHRGGCKRLANAPRSGSAPRVREGRGRRRKRPAPKAQPEKLLAMARSLVLGAGLGLCLAIIAFAITSALAKRRSRAVFLRGRRDTLFLAGLAAALGIVLGVGIARWLS